MEIKDSGERHLGNFRNKNGDKRGCYIIHGMSKTRLYSTWLDMRRRCKNPKNKSYARYGARNIKVCEEWDNDFATFQKWALANGYSDELTLERKNIDGNYEPDNCTWVTWAEQQLNTSRSHFVVINGVKKCISEWARIYGISPDLIKDRINKLNWSDYDAVTTPKFKMGGKRKKCKY